MSSASKDQDTSQSVQSPNVLLTAPTFRPNSKDGQSKDDADRGLRARRSHGHLPKPSGRRIRLHLPDKPTSPSSSIYLGSYGASSRHSISSLGESLRNGGSRPASLHREASQDQLEQLLQDVDVDFETYGLEEYRDGFFDASFFKPSKTDKEKMMRDAEETLPETYKKDNPLSISRFLPHQWHEMLNVAQKTFTTRAGIKLTKSFLGFFIAYILCLVPDIRLWLGRYSYIMVLSTIINHSGRTVGAQIDGAILTSLGTAFGLGYGAFALWVSDSTSVAQQGYGGILAAFLLIFMAFIAYVRSYFIRLYQLIISAGIAISYTCLADTSEIIRWRKFYDYGIPWLFGQAICLLVACVCFPDTSARPLAVSLHNAFEVMEEALQLSPYDSMRLHRKLAWTSVNLSQAYRDLVLDVSITRFGPPDILRLRNLMQGVTRSLLAFREISPIVDEFKRFQRARPTVNEHEFVINIENSSLHRTKTEEEASRIVVDTFAEVTMSLLSDMISGLAACDAIIMDFSGYRKYLGPPKTVSSDVLGSLTRLRKGMIAFDEKSDTMHANESMVPSSHAEVIEAFLFINRIRLVAASVEPLLVKVMEMQQHRRPLRIYLPSYPFYKALQRTNAQVRHDRGGVTAGFFFRNQEQLLKLMKKVMAKSAYEPMPRDIHSLSPDEIGEAGENMAPDGQPSKPRIGFKFWTLLHHLQGFETRFALKVAMSTSLLSVPAWLPQSRGWWNENESWWAVVMLWLLMHPRVGGNFQDLVTRVLCSVLGSIWGGLAYGAGNGNPYVMAVFAAIFMIPMLYRFTQSSHPRSGAVGCFSFVIVSLSEKSLHGLPSVTTVAWTRGVAMGIGVLTAVLINWMLWPFIARHELRKALSHSIMHCAILYRRIVAKYIYYEPGEEPTAEDLEESELIEGRLREGFVRIRQLMALTRHEIRLRGPFDPLPYSALIEACEHFFERLIEVRQSSLFFNPHALADNELATEALVAYRRDAVATILMNLYVLAGALRGDRKVPRYLPSAAYARKRLLDRMEEVETQLVQDGNPQNLRDRERATKKWAYVYQYSYSTSLTDCVEQVELLQKYTKAICGEQGFDPPTDIPYEEINETMTM